ncbi:MAG TPA: alkaline phosphatase D family protein [Solirubrobacterales bacterium]|nr:alkaline phosphatase D family protein [Solirubrobacterales bacterium]
MTAVGDSGIGRQGLRRREFLVGGAAAGLTLAAPLNYAAIARGQRLPFAKGGKFAHGVASGFPSPKAITVWTRLSGIDRSSKLTVEVATDKGFNKVLESVAVKAEKSRDYTVHHRIKGLEPGEQYFYRFFTQGKESRVGKFRTAPPTDSKETIRIGYFSCQNWNAGFYNAQAGLAKEKDLDLVLCLGDYIYEKGTYSGPRSDTTGVNGDGNVQTLDEYRQKYRLYQSDKALQDMHAAHPFVMVWDDHEVEDNYAGDEDLDNGGDIRRVPFEERRKNAYKAFFEAMPKMKVKGDPTRIYGSAKLGGAAELFFTDQRQYRDTQPCDDAILGGPCPDAENPARTMLGATQKAWFKSAVSKSKANWKLWGSETMVMSVDQPQGTAVQLDAWDGYSGERKEILEHFVANGVQNLAAITGDIHTFIAGDMTTTGRQGGTPAGVELVGGSATSLGLPEFLGVPSSALYPIAAAEDPHIKFVDLDRRGYAVVTATKKDLTCEFKAVDALTPGATPTPLKAFRVVDGVPALQVV